MTCTHTVNCPLFAQFAMDPALQVWKSHYCDGDYNSCARYNLSKTGKAVPLSLLPNGKQVQIKERSQAEMSATALFNAIQKNRLPMVKSMISTSSASVNVTSSGGISPLMLAVNLGHKEIVDALLEKGANPFIKNAEGNTARDIANLKNFAEIAMAIELHMAKNPSLADKATSAVVTSTEEAEEEDVKSVVGFLKKLNPFSRK